MNTFEFNNFSSPIVNHWAGDNYYCDQDDNNSVLSFLKDQDDLFEPKNQEFSFGLDWLVDSDKNRYHKGSFFQTERDDLFSRNERTKSLHLGLGALESLVGQPMKDNFEEENDFRVQIKKTIKKKPVKVTKSASKALSVKCTKSKVASKATLVKKIAKSHKKSNPKIWKNLETCSNYSDSRKSTDAQSASSRSNSDGFSDIEEIRELINQDVESAFKLNEKGKASNIPQIFTTNLFSKSSERPQEEVTSVFMAATMLKKKNSTAAS